jgi:amidase
VFITASAGRDPGQKTMDKHKASSEPQAAASDTDAIVYRDARLLAEQMAAGSLSAREVMTAFLQRIETCNPVVNAICTLLPAEQALALADEADRQRRAGSAMGPLHGLPIAVKDLSPTRGMRTTMGSPIFADNIPDEDSLLVQRLRAAGALVIGKTNTPEFGTGSHTFNPLFGITRNPYDTDKSAGGSSGGAAAALACGMLPLADGSDMGGSLRNPAAFCNVVGFRPSMGRVPHWPNAMAWQSRLGVEGSMARNVEDCALLLSVLAGPDERDPLSIQESPAQFQQNLEYDFSGARIGWTPDLGILPVAREVAEVCAATLPHWRDCGFEIDEACPNLDGAMDCFKVLRASFYAQFGGPLLATHRELMKDTVIENIEAGLQLAGTDITAADARRTQLYQQVLRFFDHHDFLLLPSTQVSPFPVEREWVTEIEGQAMSSYLDWMSICCIITLFGLPAISVPCGFTPDGMPVGIQVVGKPRADLQVLRAAHALEQATGCGRRRPPL